MSYPEAVPDPSLEAVRSDCLPEHCSEKSRTYGLVPDQRSEHTATSIQYDTGLIPMSSLHSKAHNDTDHLFPGAAGSPGPRKAILGLRRSLFWILLGIGLAIIIASVGAGVGGGLAAARSRKESTNLLTDGNGPVATTDSSSKKKHTSTKRPSPAGSAADHGGGGGIPADSTVGSAGTGTAKATDRTAADRTAADSTAATHAATDPAATDQRTADATKTTTTTAKDTPTPGPSPGTTVTTGTTLVRTTTQKPAAASTPAAASPTFLNNQTYSQTGFAFQAFSGPAYAGRASDVVRDEGFLDLPFAANSYVWLPNGADCCVTFCSDGTTSVGWWCQERRQKDSSAAFPRVWVGCGSGAGKEHACS